MVEVGDVQQQFRFLVGRLGVDLAALNFEIDESLILDYQVSLVICTVDYRTGQSHGYVARELG